MLIGCLFIYGNTFSDDVPPFGRIVRNFSTCNQTLPFTEKNTYLSDCVEIRVETAVSVYGSYQSDFKNRHPETRLDVEDPNNFSFRNRVHIHEKWIKKKKYNVVRLIHSCYAQKLINEKLETIC